MDSSEDPVAQPPFPIGLLIALVVALTVAGLGAGFILDATKTTFDASLPDRAAANEEQILEGIRIRLAGERKSSAFAGACAGAMIVGAIGLVFGVQRRSAIGAMSGLIIGIASGALFGSVGCYSAYEVSAYTLSHAIESTKAYSMISAAFWAWIGVAAILTTAAVGPRRTPMSARIVGPTLGVALAAFFTPVVASLVFPLDYKGRIPPRTRSESLLVATTGAVLLGLGTGFCLKGRTAAAAGTPISHC